MSLSQFQELPEDILKCLAFWLKGISFQYRNVSVSEEIATQSQLC